MKKTKQIGWVCYFESPINGEHIPVHDFILAKNYKEANKHCERIASVYINVKEREKD